ncbi:hypothetical protein FHS21_002625 [Phyllobacterium trifolii]|uniref:Uncharacterized protein n=1 Tax=Phyllobacterium trifolii TaxID=300193 RepID=A0A839UB64_9HYPH|nr:hypothetical protein [Phyllobacterium trifolii]
MSLCVVEQSPGLPFSGTVPRVRSTRTGQAAWPKVRAMRSSGVGVRRMRAASRSAATAAAPCEERIDSAAARRGTRPLTRPTSGSDRSKPRTEPEAARRLCRSPRHRACPPRHTAIRRRTGRRRVLRLCPNAQTDVSLRFGGTVVHKALHGPGNAAATHEDLRKTNRPCTSMVFSRRLRRSSACLCAGLSAWPVLACRALFPVRRRISRLAPAKQARWPRILAVTDLLDHEPNAPMS